MSPIETLLNQVQYQDRKRVKSDVNALMDRYKSLLPKLASFVHNDGTESKFLSISGTFPISYNGVTYNIPVEFFIVEKYPAAPPKVFLRPTPNMTIKANHRHVDMEGCVYLPYLHEWTQKSNLVALTEMASNIFSFEPPLYTKPTTAPNPVPVPTTNQSTASAMASNAYTQSLAYVNNFSSINTRGQPVNNNPTPATTTTSSVYVPSTAFSSTGMYGNSSNTVMGTIVNNGGQPTSSYTTPSYTANHHESDKRDILVLEVTSKLQSKLQEKHISIRKEIDEEFRNQRYIETNGEKLIKAKHEIELLKHNMNQSIWEISEKITKMTEFTKEQEANDSSSEKKKELEDFILPYDDISNQMIKVNAEMNGIDDVFYYLEKALINNKLDLNAFLKESRLLARKQFLAKSHLMKLENFLIHNSQVNVIPSDQPRTMIPAAPSSSSSVAAGGMGQHMPMYLPGTIPPPGAQPYPGGSIIPPGSSPYIHGAQSHATMLTSSTNHPSHPQFNTSIGMR